MAKSNALKTAVTSPTGDARLPQENAPWVSEMHRHFGTHGHFRATDLNRLLGNPGGFTEGQAVADFVGNATARKT